MDELKNFALILQSERIIDPQITGRISKILTRNLNISGSLDHGVGAMGDQPIEY
jgi:hypothetical protein